jgi:acyl carrier protein
MSDPAHIEQRLLAFLRQGIFSEDIVVTEETDLLANGFDSLNLVALLQYIEKEFGVWLPESEINETTLKDIRHLAALIAQLLHDRPPSP